MSLPGKIAPAILWRAFFVCTLLAPVARAAVPSAPPPELLQLGKPSDAEAQALIEQLRRSGIAGEFFWEIELHALPRRGDETVFRGRIWGSRNEQGAIVRIELTDAAGKVRRLLVQNGAQPALWRFADGKLTSVGVESWLEPLLPGLDITAFDLQMPFFYWPGATVERIARSVLGRPANQFLFRPPAAFAAAHPEVSGARAYLDTQFNQPLQTELLGAKGEVTKTFALIGLKKVGEQQVPKSVDFRNEVTHDKTRLLVTGAALNLVLSPEVFTPAGLADDIRPPASGIVRFDP